MTKLCPRGKAAAKRKFKVYPSAYANAYASKICAGKIKDPSGVKRKDFRGSKASGGRIGYSDGASKKGVRQPNRNILTGKRTMGPVSANKRKPFKTIDKMIQEQTKSPKDPRTNRTAGEKMKEPISPTQRRDEGTAMKRESNDGDFRANVTRGGGAKPVELDEQMEYLALESTKILGLDIGGVDLLYDGDGYKICEVNSSPGFNGMEKYTEIRVAEQIVTYVKNKLN